MSEQMSGQMSGQSSQQTVPQPTGQPSEQATAPSPATGLLLSRTLWAGYGVAMAAMALNVPTWTWPPDPKRVAALVFSVLLFAVLAQPYAGRPVLPSMRVHEIALAHRNTLLVGAFALLAAGSEPPPWAAGVDALLLAGYLLLIDAITVPASVLRRIASPAMLLGLAALIAGTTALVALPASAGAYRPLLLAAAAAAALGAAVATAFGSAEERRVGSPGTERRNQDRSSE